MKPQSFWDNGLDLLGLRDVIDHVTLDSRYMVLYRWLFEANPLSRMVAGIFWVKHLGKHIPVKMH